jgi:hypothetical protein
MPELAAATTAAATQAKTAVDGAEAWGDPARGCYASWLALSSDRGAPSALAELTIANVVKPAAGADAGVLSLSFTRPPYQGTLRAQIGRGGSYAVLACFWNQREPIACETACNGLVGSMK